MLILRGGKTLDDIREERDVALERNHELIADVAWWVERANYWQSLADYYQRPFFVRWFVTKPAMSDGHRWLPRAGRGGATDGLGALWLQTPPRIAEVKTLSLWERVKQIWQQEDEDGGW